MLKWATELPTGFANFWNVGDRLARPVQFQHACNLGRVASRPGYPVEPAARSRPCGRVPAGSRVERNALHHLPGHDPTSPDPHDPSHTKGQSPPDRDTLSYQPGPPRSLTYKRDGSGQSDLSSYIISLITRSLHSCISARSSESASRQTRKTRRGKQLASLGFRRLSVRPQRPDRRVIRNTADENLEGAWNTPPCPARPRYIWRRRLPGTLAYRERAPHTDRPFGRKPAALQTVRDET